MCKGERDGVGVGGCRDLVAALFIGLVVRNLLSDLAVLGSFRELLIVTLQTQNANRKAHAHNTQLTTEHTNHTNHTNHTSHAYYIKPHTILYTQTHRRTLATLPVI